MHTQEKFRYLIILFLLIVFPAGAVESLDAFVPQSTSANTTEEDTGTQITTFFLESEQDLAEAVERAGEMVEDARAQNPGVKQVKVVVVQPRSGQPFDSSVNPQEVIAEVSHQIPDLLKIAVKPDNSLDSKLEEIDEFYFQHAAMKQITKTRTVLAVLRSFVAGSVCSIALASLSMPLPAIIAGGLAAAFISGRMQLLNDYMKNWLADRAFWDPKDHRDCPSFGWKVTYGSWKFIKESLLIFGYLTAMHWVISSFGGSQPEFLTNSLPWLAMTLKTTVLSTFSEGAWSVYDADRRRQLLTQNWEENKTHFREGIAKADHVLLKSQYLAIAVAAISTLAQVLSVSGDTYFSPRILLGLGISAGATYLWNCTNIFKFGRFFRLPNSCKDAFGQFFS